MCPKGMMQRDICAQIAQRFDAQGRRPLALVDTYGCQQNEADSEKLRGMLSAMGYEMTRDEWEADVIVINTCSFEQRTFESSTIISFEKM